MNGETIAMIKALQVKSIENLKTSGGNSDAGKVLTVGSDGKITPTNLPVGEGEIALDGTLTIAGAAADAKVVGDAISAVNGSLSYQNSDKELWQIGAISATNGSNTDSTKYLRTGILPSYVKGFVCSNDTEVSVKAYDQSRVYVGSWNGTTFVKSATGYYTSMVSFPNKNYKYRLLLRNAVDTESDVTVDLANNVNFIYDIAEQSKRYFDSVECVSSDRSIWQIGIIKTNDGETSSTAVNRLRTKFLPSYVRGFVCENNTSAIICAYRQDGTYVGYWNGSKFAKLTTALESFDKLLEFPSVSYKYKLMVKDNLNPDSDVTIDLADNVKFIYNLGEFTIDYLTDTESKIAALTSRTVQNSIQWKRQVITSSNGTIGKSVKFLMTDFLPESLQTATCSEGYAMGAFCYYKSDGTYAGFYNGTRVSTENFVTTGYFTSFDFAYLRNRYPAVKWILLLSNRADTTAPMQVDDAENVTLTYQGQTVEEIAKEIAYPKKAYKSGRIYFEVEVKKPVSFGGEEIETTPESVQAVLMLPSTYTPTGKKTRLVMCCHGAHGYIDAVNDEWYDYSSDWKLFINQLLAAGYAVFDANVLSGNDTTIIGYALGSPLYVQALRKAYDYIVERYNVHDKIFVHGVSMGGVGASRFSNTYPEICLAESSFAGRDLYRYLNEYSSTHDMSRLTNMGIVHGYASDADMLADHFSRVLGYPSLALQKYVNGVLVPIPDRETDFNNWVDYYSDIFTGTDSADTYYVGYYAVPYKSWNSMADSVMATELEEKFAKAYTRGSAVPHYAVTYQTGTHHEISYGLVNDLIPQLLTWYHRWE